MGIMKVAVIALVTMLVLGIVLSAGWIMVDAGKYIFNQHFQIGTAFKWAWSDYWSMVDLWDAFYREEAEVLEFDFVNKNVDVVACTSL